VRAERIRYESAMRLAVALAALAAFSCAKVTPHLVVPDVALDDPAFIPTMEAVTSAPATAGNDVTVLLNGDEIFPAQLAAIRGARQTITYAQYFYEDGPIARDIAEALAERCRQGVNGHVLLDGFGTLMMPAEYRKIMEDGGCRIAVFRPVGRFGAGRTNNRNHRRILVVDGVVASRAARVRAENGWAMAGRPGTGGRPMCASKGSSSSPSRAPSSRTGSRRRE
jgi:hypothetical protein